MTTALKSQQVDFQGVTGVLRFHVERMPQNKPVYILEAKEPRPTVVLRCGEFSEEDVWRVWGDENHPCPED